MAWRMWNKQANRPCTREEQARIEADLRKPKTKKGVTPKK